MCLQTLSHPIMLHPAARWHGGPVNSALTDTTLFLKINIWFPASRSRAPHNRGDIGTRPVYLVCFLCDEPPQSDRQKDLHEDRNDHDVFNGGLIPNFILMNKLHLYNTFWVFVLPGMFTFYNMIIFISFFKTIPESLLESARLDGASEFRIYWQILLPNCKAVLATIGLYSAVYNWNDYYLGVIYIRNKNPAAAANDLIQAAGRNDDELPATGSDDSFGWANVSLYDQVRGHGRRNASNPVYLSVHSKVFGQRCHDWLYQGIRQHSTWNIATIF